MIREFMLDETFHRFVNHIESVYAFSGAFWVPTSIRDLNKRELDEILWEVEEEYGEMPTQVEIKECFTDALSYVNDIYRSLKSKMVI